MHRINVVAIYKHIILFINFTYPHSLMGTQMQRVKDMEEERLLGDRAQQEERARGEDVAEDRGSRHCH